MELYEPDGFVGRVYQVLTPDGRVVIEAVKNDYITDVGWLVLTRITGKQERVTKFGREEDALKFLRKAGPDYLAEDAAIHNAARRQALQPSGVEKQETSKYPRVSRGRGWRG